jgi:hypothetical protein
LIANADCPPWIAAEHSGDAANGRDAAAWAILREAGRFIAAPAFGTAAGFAGLPSAADAARIVRKAAGGR